MCANSTNCGKYTYTDLSRRVAFSRPSVVRKLTAASHLPAPQKLETPSGFEYRFCSVHLKHLTELEAERL